MVLGTGSEPGQELDMAIQERPVREESLGNHVVGIKSEELNQLLKVELGMVLHGPYI